MNELYHASVFFASLEFKCMQRSKPPFRRQRWCNKQKPLDYFRRSPPSTVTLLQPSLHSTARCYCKLPPGGRSAQECFFLPSVFFLITLSSVSSDCACICMCVQFHSDHKSTLRLNVALKWLHKVTTSPVLPLLMAPLLRCIIKVQLHHPSLHSRTCNNFLFLPDC